MWDMRGARSFGRLSVRNILMFVTAMLATVFIYSFFAAPTAYAADATWKDSSITYKGNQYTPVADAKENDSRGLEKGTKIYAYAEPTASGKKAHLIYFAPGADPPKEKKATYITYDFTPPDTHENPSGKTSISLDPSTASKKGTTSCDATFTHGIGWIVCPITNALAGAMDWLFEVLTGFLAVRPVQTSQDTALFRAWAYMRNFANVAFVMGFLVIIYSQLTSIGITNYAVKKMLPRLVIAAILVNVSYWICAVAIDISNILGYSIQDIFIAIRNSLVGGEGNNWDVVSWESITGFILSGGTAAAALGVGGYLMVAGAGGAIYLLLPILLGVLMAVLVALLVMAARQAIITILVIISPLAFVAYLLPNTEKYFEKWHKLGFTMLLMFPIFSVVFGGSQLAGQAIIQNADSINLLILGMAVQVAPLAITPLLMRVSGSLLGKIGGVVNNPSKGLIDRSRKWAQERADQHKDRQLAYGTSRLAGTARRIDNSRRKREGWQKRNQAATDNRFNSSTMGKTINDSMRDVERDKQIIEQKADRRWNVKSQRDTQSLEKELLLRVSTDQANRAKADMDAVAEEFKAGVAPVYGPQTQSMDALRNQATDTTQALALASMRKKAAEHTQNHQFAQALENSAALRTKAGGIDPNGALKAEAEAMSDIAKRSDEELNATTKLLNFKALKAGTTIKNLTSTMVSDTMAGTASYSSGEIEAALDVQAKDGQIVVLENARMNPAIDQAILSRVIAQNDSLLKVKGGFHLQADPTLEGAPMAIMNRSRAASLGDTTASNFKDLKQGWIKHVAANINSIIPDANHNDLQKVYDNVHQALNNPQIRATIGDRIEAVQDIEKALKARGYTETPTTRI